MFEEFLFLNGVNFKGRLTDIEFIPAQFTVNDGQQIGERKVI